MKPLKYTAFLWGVWININVGLYYLIVIVIAVIPEHCHCHLLSHGWLINNLPKTLCLFNANVVASIVVDFFNIFFQKYQKNFIFFVYKTSTKLPRWCIHTTNLFISYFVTISKCDTRDSVHTHYLNDCIYSVGMMWFWCVVGQSFYGWERMFKFYSFYFYFYFSFFVLFYTTTITTIMFKTFFFCFKL